MLSKPVKTGKYLKEKKFSLARHPITRATKSGTTDAYLWTSKNNVYFSSIIHFSD